jgi:CheY-like chemotaxis protein
MTTSFQDDLSGDARDRPIEAPAVARLFGDRPGIDAGPGKTLNRPAERVCDDAVVRKRVLIVDDHEPFRAVARELLERAGYIVTGEAGDAAEALAAIAAEAPDVVLLDVQLPDQDGFAVATAVAASQGPAIVLISSREADAYGRRVVSCGARGFIPKSKLSATTFAAALE